MDLDARIYLQMFCPFTCVIVCYRSMIIKILFCTNGWPSIVTVQVRLNFELSNGILALLRKWSHLENIHEGGHELESEIRHILLCVTSVCVGRWVHSCAHALVHTIIIRSV